MTREWMVSIGHIYREANLATNILANLVRIILLRHQRKVVAREWTVSIRRIYWVVNLATDFLASLAINLATRLWTSWQIWPEIFTRLHVLIFLWVFNGQ